MFCEILEALKSDTINNNSFSNNKDMQTSNFNFKKIKELFLTFEFIWYLFIVFQIGVRISVTNLTQSERVICQPHPKSCCSFLARYGQSYIKVFDLSFWKYYTMTPTALWHHIYITMLTHWFFFYCWFCFMEYFQDKR